MHDLVNVSKGCSEESESNLHSCNTTIYSLAVVYQPPSEALQYDWLPWGGVGGRVHWYMITCSIDLLLLSYTPLYGSDITTPLAVFVV